MNRDNHLYVTAAKVVADLLLRQSPLVMPPRTVLNINVPDIPHEQLKGIKVTRLGHRAKGLPPQATADPRGRERFWISLAGEGDDAGPGTDFHAVAHDYVSITPLQVDMTRHDVMRDLEVWLEE